MAGQSSAVAILGLLLIGSCLALGRGSGGGAVSPPAVAQSPTPHPILAAAIEEPTTYTVVAGDGWYVIARKVGLDPAELLTANDATIQTVIHPGQVLRLSSHARPSASSVRAPSPRVQAPQPTYVAPPTYRTIPYEGNGGGPTLCADGSVSGSSGRGTCSHHGGIGGGAYHHHSGGGHHSGGHRH